MSLNLSNPSQKQSLLVIAGIVTLVVILAVIGSMYGRFLKTSVAPGTTYSGTGNLKADALEPGRYTLKFSGRDKGVVASQSLQFEITGGTSATSTPLPTTSSIPPY